MQKIYEVFSCRNGEWVLAGGTSDRSEAERMFAEAVKDKASQGARLVEEGMDPNTGDIRDRVIQKRDKQENLPYFNPRKASEAAAAAKRAGGGRSAPAGGGIELDSPRPAKAGVMAGTAPPITAEAVKEVAHGAAVEAGTGFTRWLTLNMAAVGIPTGLFIAHERFIQATQTEIALAAGVVLMIVLLVVLNKDALTAERHSARPARAPRPQARPAPPPRRKRMRVIGILGKEPPAPPPEEPRPEVVEEDTRSLLQLLQKSLEILAGDGRFVKGGRLNQVDVFGCHLFFAGAAETAMPPAERNAEERSQALRAVLSVLSNDARMIDWFMGGIDGHREDAKAAAMYERGRAAGGLWHARKKGAEGKLLEALVAWNAVDPDGPPTVTLLYATMPINAAPGANAVGANAVGDRLTLARVRGAVGARAGRELRATERTIVASFVTPREAVAAAADIQVGNEADRAADPTVPQLRLAVHGRAGLSLTDEEAVRDAIQTAATLATRLANGTVVLSGPVAAAVDGLYATEGLGGVTPEGGAAVEAFALGTPVDAEPQAAPMAEPPAEAAEATPPAPAEAAPDASQGVDPAADPAVEDAESGIDWDELDSKLDARLAEDAARARRAESPAA